MISLNAGLNHFFVPEADAQSAETALRAALIASSVSALQLPTRAAYGPLTAT